MGLGVSLREAPRPMPATRASRRPEVDFCSSRLQPHQIDQKLAPKINHPTPGVSYVACCGLFENAFMNIVRDLVAQIVLHFCLNLIFIERVDYGSVHPVSTKKLAMTLIKLPKRLIRPLPIDAEQRSKFQAIGERIIPRRPNCAAPGAR
jgi:hypothetical protein